jgi:hypothetical protein
MLEGDSCSVIAIDQPASTTGGRRSRVLFYDMVWHTPGS